MEPSLEASKMPPPDTTDAGKTDAEKKKESEESIKWLRERGVQVETVEDRKKSAQMSTTFYKGHADAKEIKFVRIPADSHAALEQLVFYIPKGGEGYGDKLPEMLRCEFTSGSLDHELFQRTAQTSFGAESSKLSASAVEKSVSQGSTETFRLVAPAETNGYHGVYMYLDEVGMLKGLPINGRATALAEACGFGPPPPTFYGDIYIGRVRTRPTPMRSVDFTVADMDSSQEWLRRAQGENFEYHEAMGQVTNAMESSKLGVADEGLPNEDETKAFTWSQTPEDVEVTVPVDKNVNKKQLKVRIERQFISVTVDVDPKVEVALSLFAPVDVDESTWSFSDGQVVVTMEKTREDQWSQIRKLEAK